MRKIAFFDIDGTLTSEVDGSVPKSAKTAILRARENGHLMFLNTGRCFQNVEMRFREVGFDGYVCGCGTNVYCNGVETVYHPQSHETTLAILEAARRADVDLLFESRNFVSFDLTRPLRHPWAISQYERFLERHYDMPDNFEDENFFCDKFVIWFEAPSQLEEFRKTSDRWFSCIDRNGTFREFIPYGYSKSTGIQAVLNYYRLPLSAAYAFGDSNNDLSMLSYVPHSIAMGNCAPKDLMEKVSYVTTKASEDGIANALEHFGFS